MVYRKDWNQPAAGGQGFARTMKCFGRRINLNAVDLGTTGNVVGLFMVPENFVIVDMIGPAQPGFGTALVVSIGDPGNTARYLSASGGLAAAGAIPAMAASGQFFRTFAPTEIQMLITTQSSAPVAGILELYFRGFTW
jgi:hypothetical protein